MIISFSPVYGLPEMTLSRDLDVITINGADYDFSGVGEGDVLPQSAVSCNLLVSDVTRISGKLHFTLILPYGDGAGNDAIYPEAIDVITNGPVTLPSFGG